MKTALYLVPLLAATVSVLVWSELTRKGRLIYVLKPLSTLLVMAMALLSFGDAAHNATYSAGVLVGLLFSFGGDVALMFQESRKAFLIGLVLFLLAHVVYALVFGSLGRWSALDIASTVALVVAGAAFYRLIRGNLGKMRLPVIVYMIVISIMVSRAASTLASPLLSTAQGAMISVGAVLFYLSDVILATARFWKAFRYHRLSLGLYYGGQMLIALAASYFGGA